LQAREARVNFPFISNPDDIASTGLIRKKTETHGAQPRDVFSAVFAQRRATRAANLTRMRTWAAASLLMLAAAAPQQNSQNPEDILAHRFQFSSAEIGHVRNGQPIVKMLPAGSRDELAIGGAIRLPGTKERLSNWVRNIEHFRSSAQLGVTQVVPIPPTAAAFAALPADESVRNTLFGYANAYVTGGNAAVTAHAGPQAPRSFEDDTRVLLQQATTLSALAPELVAFLDAYPKTTLAGADQLLYWSAMPADADAIISLHHLVVYHPPGREVWIADKTIHATRDIDAGIVAIGLYDAAGGAGFYAIAGSRVKASRLGGVAGTLLRRQVERGGIDTVKTYLEWLRDSLAQP